MKRYTWDDLYEMADDKPCGSAELKAKDKARHQIRCRIMDSAMHDIEDDECPEDSIDDWLRFGYEQFGRHLMFDDAGNIQPMPEEKALQDIFIYVPAANQIVRIAEGTGDNLLHEDEELGYVDYLYYEQYGMEQDFPEEDGGMMLLKVRAFERYDTMYDAIEDILDMAYGNSKAKFVALMPDERFEKIKIIQ